MSRRRQSDIRLPISRHVLHELVRSLRFTNSSAFQQTPYRAMFLLAFYGFFRIGELAAKSAISVSTVVQFSALRFLICNGKRHFLKLVISEYKHNINNRPFEILIAREDCPAQFCPVQAILDYLVLRGNRPGPLFCHCSLAPITADQFNIELQRFLSFCGLDTRRYKGHSFALEPHRMRPTKVSRMHKSPLLVAGSPMPLKFIYAQGVCLGTKFMVPQRTAWFIPNTCSSRLGY